MRNDIAERGKKYYDEHLKEILEPEHTGEFVTIDAETGSYYVGKTAVEAIKQGMEALPGKKLFLARIGFEAAYKIGGFYARPSR